MNEIKINITSYIRTALLAWGLIIVIGCGAHAFRLLTPAVWEFVDSEFFSAAVTAFFAAYALIGIIYQINQSEARDRIRDERTQSLIRAVNTQTAERMERLGERAQDRVLIYGFEKWKKSFEFVIKMNQASTSHSPGTLPRLISQFHPEADEMAISGQAEIAINNLNQVIDSANSKIREYHKTISPGHNLGNSKTREAMIAQFNVVADFAAALMQICEGKIPRSTTIVTTQTNLSNTPSDQ